VLMFWTDTPYVVLEYCEIKSITAIIP